VLVGVAPTSHQHHIRLYPLVMFYLYGHVSAL
jgi:hypothetical protein